MKRRNFLKFIFPSFFGASLLAQDGASGASHVSSNDKQEPSGRRPTLDSGAQIANSPAHLREPTNKLEFLPSGQGAKTRSIPARLRETCVTPGDMMAPEGGHADATTQLALAVKAAAEYNRPLLINGVYRLDRPLALHSNLTITGSGHLRANHQGSMLAKSGDDILSRVNIYGISLESSSQTLRAIDGNKWQYCTFKDIRFMSSGGYFIDTFYFSNSSYWNTCRDIEIESGINCFNLGDTNNLILDNINWCRFDDIGMKSFMKFHDSCSMISGRNLSVEGIFRDTTLITLHPKGYGIDLEFIRIEGRLGSSANKFMDFNGSRGNSIRIPAAVYGMFGGVLMNEEENFVAYLDSSGGGLLRMGGARAVAPVSSGDPDVPGSFNYNKTLGRLRAFMDGARSIFVTPALDNLDMNGHEIAGVRALRLVEGTQRPRPNSGSSVLFIDAVDGNLKIRFSDGRVKTIVTDD